MGLVQQSLQSTVLHAKKHKGTRGYHTLLDANGLPNGWPVPEGWGRGSATALPVTAIIPRQSIFIRPDLAFSSLSSRSHRRQ